MPKGTPKFNDVATEVIDALTSAGWEHTGVTHAGFWTVTQMGQGKDLVDVFTPAGQRQDRVWLSPAKGGKRAEKRALGALEAGGFKAAERRQKGLRIVRARGRRNAPLPKAWPPSPLEAEVVARSWERGRERAAAQAQETARPYEPILSPQERAELTREERKRLAWSRLGRDAERNAPVYVHRDVPALDEHPGPGATWKTRFFSSSTNDQLEWVISQLEADDAGRPRSSASIPGIWSDFYTVRRTDPYGGIYTFTSGQPNSAPSLIAKGTWDDVEPAIRARLAKLTRAWRDARLAARGQSNPPRRARGRRNAPRSRWRRDGQGYALDGEANILPYRPTAYGVVRHWADRYEDDAGRPVPPGTKYLLSYSTDPGGWHGVTPHRSLAEAKAKGEVLIAAGKARARRNAPGLRFAERKPTTLGWLYEIHDSAGRKVGELMQDDFEIFGYIDAWDDWLLDKGLTPKWVRTPIDRRRPGYAAEHVRAGEDPYKNIADAKALVRRIYRPERALTLEEQRKIYESEKEAIREERRMGQLYRRGIRAEERGGRRNPPAFVAGDPVAVPRWSVVGGRVKRDGMQSATVVGRYLAAPPGWPTHYVVTLESGDTLAVPAASIRARGGDAPGDAQANPPLLPLTSSRRKWDAAKARRALKKWATTKGGRVDMRKYARAFLIVDGDPANLSSYKLPIATVVKDKRGARRLKAVPHAIYAAAGVIDGARGGVDASSRAQERAREALTRYYKKMKKAPPWGISNPPRLRRARRNPGPTLSAASRRAPPAIRRA